LKTLYLAAAAADEFVSIIIDLLLLFITGFQEFSTLLN